MTLFYILQGLHIVFLYTSYVFNENLTGGCLFKVTVHYIQKSVENRNVLCLFNVVS